MNNFNPAHRLLIKVVDKSRPVLLDSQNRKLTPVKYVEVKSLDLGSLNNPTKICKEILEIRIEPVTYN